MPIDVKEEIATWINLSEDVEICDLCIYDRRIYCLDISGKIIVFDVGENFKFPQTILDNQWC